MAARTGRARAAVRLTMAGRLLLCAGAIAGAAGWASEDNRLLLLACVLAAAPIVSRVTVRRALRGISARAEAPAECFAHERFRCAIVLSKDARNGRVPAAFGLGVATRPERGFRLVGHPFVPVLAVGSTVTVVPLAQFSSRGRRRIPPVVVRTQHPFGLAEANLELPVDAGVLVLPAPAPLPRARLRALSTAASASAAAAATRDPEETASLVDWRPGIPARWVHARSSARRARPTARDLRGTPAGEVLIVLDASPPDGQAHVAGRFARRFERGVAWAAALVLLLEREARRHRLLAGSLPPASGRAALRTLAEIAAAPGAIASLDSACRAFVWISPAGRPVPPLARGARAISLFASEDAREVSR